MGSTSNKKKFLSVEEKDCFLELFPHRWDFLRAAHPEPGSPPAWKTESRYPLSDRIFRAGGWLFGVRFGKETEYLLVDLDKKSPYHPANDRFAVGRISEALSELGLTDFLAVTSSYSGGIHLYYPFSRAVESWKLGTAVTVLLEKAGFSVRPGRLEVFPNRRSATQGKSPALFNAHRLPLQLGSYLLNSEWEIQYSSEVEFARRWQFCKRRNQIQQLDFWVNRGVSDKRLTNRAQEFLDSLNSEIDGGWTDFGQTNRILGRIALREFVFGGFLRGESPLTGDRLVAAIVSVALALPGFRDFCQHQHEIWKRAEEWASCVENSRYWPYRGQKLQAPGQPGEPGEPDEPRWQEVAANRSREKIRRAIATLLEENRLPIGATERFQVLSREFSIGGSTLYKNRDLWHPEAVETPPAPPQRENEVGSELCGEFTTHSISNLLEQTSRNTALGTGFSDFVHDCEQKTSRNNALEADFKDSS